jgi:hypothetical protein
MPARLTPVRRNLICGLFAFFSPFWVDFRISKTPLNIRADRKLTNIPTQERLAVALFVHAYQRLIDAQRFLKPLLVY